MTCEKKTNICLICSIGYYFENPNSTTCLSLKPYHYNDGRQWLPCHVSCEICTEAGTDTDRKCKQCRAIPKYFKVQGKEDDYCGSQVEFPELYPAGDTLYLTEQPFQKNDLCTKCERGKYCLGGDIKCITYSEIPGKGYFVDEFKQTVLKCNPLCETCKDLADNCLECPPSLYLHPSKRCLSKL